MHDIMPPRKSGDSLNKNSYHARRDPIRTPPAGPAVICNLGGSSDEEIFFIYDEFGKLHKLQIPVGFEK